MPKKKKISHQCSPIDFVNIPEISVESMRKFFNTYSDITYPENNLAYELKNVHTVEGKPLSNIKLISKRGRTVYLFEILKLVLIYEESIFQEIISDGLVPEELMVGLDATKKFTDCLGTITLLKDCISHFKKLQLEFKNFLIDATQNKIDIQFLNKHLYCDNRIKYFEDEKLNDLEYGIYTNLVLKPLLRKKKDSIFPERIYQRISWTFESYLAWDLSYFFDDDEKITSNYRIKLCKCGCNQFFIDQSSNHSAKYHPEHTVIARKKSSRKKSIEEKK